MRGYSSISLVSLLCLAHCAAPAPKPAAPIPTESEHQMVNPLVPDEDDDPDGMQVEGTLGTLDQRSIQAGLTPSLERVTACFTDGSRGKHYLGGEVELQFRISRQGTIKKLRMIRSSLGAYSIERCILDQMKSLTFAKPFGGEAEFTYPLMFQGRVQPVVWDMGMVKEEILNHIDTLLLAQEGPKPQMLVAPAGLVITFYVSSQGRVLSAGLTADEEVDELFADRFIHNLKQIKFIEPQSQFGKVSYRW